VTEEPRSQPSPRARPLAELRLDPVLARVEQLAQGWASALIFARPLEGMGAIPLQEIAREGSSLCTQVLRALQSDVELDRLTGQGPSTGREQAALGRRVGALTGAQDAVAVSDAVEALRGVLWEALLEDLHWPGHSLSAARQLAELSDRLATVCARVLAASLARQPAFTAAVPDTGGESQSEHASPRDEPALRSAVVIVDERLEASAKPTAGRREQAEPPAGERAAPLLAALPERPLSWDESPPVPPARRGAEIEIRDERREEGPAAWIGSIGSQLERYAQDGVPFAVLLIEPVEIERLRHTESSGELAHVAEDLEEALAAIWSGSVTRQRPGRYWLIAPAVNRLGVRELAERLQRDLAPTVLYRGAPLELAVGTAACPDDGSEASALAAHADVGLYAARSAARGGKPRAATPVDEPA
jgi:hypothetical protein